MIGEGLLVELLAVFVYGRYLAVKPVVSTRERAGYEVWRARVVAEVEAALVLAA